MRFIVDSNVLFTFFWKDSVFRKILLKQKLILFSPDYALEEINKYSEEITVKAKISKHEFKKSLAELLIFVEFIHLKEYLPFIKDAGLLAENLSNEEKQEFLLDIDFSALAISLNCSLWSNDSILKKQQKVNVFSTKEIIELIGSL